MQPGKKTSLGRCGSRVKFTCLTRGNGRWAWLFLAGLAYATSMAAAETGESSEPKGVDRTKLILELLFEGDLADTSESNCACTPHGEVTFVEALERSGDHVADGHSRSGGDRRCVRRRCRPREDLDLDAAPSQPDRGLPNVDVHPARVTGARLRQRRGVHGDQRDTPRQRARGHDLHHREMA